MGEGGGGLWKCIDRKIFAIGLWGFTETVLVSTSGKILVMWDVLVVNGMIQSLMFLF